MTKLLAAFVIIVVSTVATGTLLAQDLDSGWEAYDSGDYATALKIWTPLAEQGNSQAQGVLGMMYANGEGVSQDFAEAMRWFHKAVEQGHAAAQYGVGKLYANGQGVAQDYAKAVKWFRLAAEKGVADANRTRLRIRTWQGCSKELC